MNSEDEYSRNLMALNAYYIKRDLDYELEHPYRIRIKALAKRALNILKHMKNIGVNGLEKTKILLRAELTPKTLIDYEWRKGCDYEYELNYKFRHNNTDRIAVYTAVFGDYDYIKEPLYKAENCDFYIITDMDVPEGSAWKKYTPNVEEFNALDDYHKSKYCKLYPHILFPDYKYSLWVDGNVKIVADINPLIDRIQDGYKMAAFMHPIHNSIYTEFYFLIYHNAAPLELLKKQINEYRKAGFPNDFGMREFSIIAREHNDGQLIKLMEEWWEELNRHTMRDQISFPYVLWKNGLTIDYIFLLGDHWRYNPRFIYITHNWRLKF